MDEIETIGAAEMAAIYGNRNAQAFNKWRSRNPEQVAPPHIDNGKTRLWIREDAERFFREKPWTKKKSTGRKRKSTDIEMRLT